MKSRVNICLIVLEVAVAAVLIACLVMFGRNKVNDELTLADIKKELLSDMDLESSFRISDSLGLKKYYALTATDYEDFLLYLPASNMDASELLIIVLNDESQATDVVEACRARLIQEKSVFENYGVDQMELLNSAKLLQAGRYIMFAVCANADDLAQEFEKMVGSSQDLSTIEREETVDTNKLSTLSTEETTIVDNSEPETPQTYDAHTQEILDDAGYYYKYYSAVSLVYSVKSEVFDAEKFLQVYEQIAGESLEDYFTDEHWGINEGGNSLNLYATEKLYVSGNMDSYLWMARAIHAFSLIRDRHEGDEEWDNPDSLKPQFHCHVLYAGAAKTPWNIESYRTETSFIKIMMARGNPQPSE